MRRFECNSIVYYLQPAGAGLVRVARGGAQHGAAAARLYQYGGGALHPGLAVHLHRTTTLQIDLMEKIYYLFILATNPYFSPVR